VHLLEIGLVVSPGVGEDSIFETVAAREELKAEC